MLINVYVASPDPNPRGGGQLPNPNECNSTLTSGTRGIYPHCYILMLMSGVTGYEFATRCADTKFEFTHFAAEKLHRTSEEFLYYLDNHYTYALQHTQSNFMDFIVYITRKLPINISTQILNHI